MLSDPPTRNSRVEVSSYHTVHCANDTSWRSLKTPFRLRPLDQCINPVIPIAVVFLYQQCSPSSEGDILPIDRLERAMSLILDFYPHLTGRLNVAVDGSTQITRLGTGTVLIEARCNNRLDTFAGPSGRFILSDLPDGGNALLPPINPLLEGVCQEPMFAIQHTRFACGNVALGIRLPHVTCDAAGYFRLIRDLAEVYRSITTSELHGGMGLTTASLAAPHIRSYLSDFDDTVTENERQAYLKYQPPVYHIERSPSAPSAGTATLPAPPNPVVGRFMRFSGEDLKTIKAQATNTSINEWISTFDALCAYLFQSIHRARSRLRSGDSTHPELSPADFLTPINLRTRLGHESLPPRYFPNAGYATTTTLDLDAPLQQTARAIHDMTRMTYMTSGEEIDKTLKCLAIQPDKSKIKHRFRYGSGSLMISAWNKFDQYSAATFDVRPVLVAPPFTVISRMDGLLYLLPTGDEGTERDKGDIVVAIALNESVWRMLEEDEEFRRHQMHGRDDD